MGLITTLVLAAVWGTSSAFATETVLCKVNKTPCPSEQIEPAGSYLAGGAFKNNSNTRFKISTSDGLIYTCDNFLLGAETTEKSGNPLYARGEAYMYPAPCKLTSPGGTEYASCAASVSVPKAKISRFGELGILEFGVGAEERSKFTFECSGGWGTCHFGTSKISLTYYHVGEESSGLAYLESGKKKLETEPGSSGLFCKEPTLDFKGAVEFLGWPPYVTSL